MFRAFDEVVLDHLGAGASKFVLVMELELVLTTARGGPIVIGSRPARR